MLSCILLLTATTRYTKITTNTSTAQHWLDLYSRVSCRRRLSLISIYYYKRLFSDLRCDRIAPSFLFWFLYLYMLMLQYKTYMYIESAWEKSSRATSEDLSIWMELEPGYFQHLHNYLTSFWYVYSTFFPLFYWICLNHSRIEWLNTTQRW